MLALVTEPGVPGTTRVDEVPAVRAGPAEVLVRTLEVGVCGTDREIVDGVFGVAPDGRPTLVLGHELLGVVERDGHGFARGDLVTATVRRPCGRCAPCAEGSPDSCRTGAYLERGITGLDGFARELVAEDPGQLVAIPSSLGRLGVLAEPASICTRGLRHARAIGGRHPWELGRALVIGAGAVGMLSTYLLRLAGVDVWTAALEPEGDPRAELVRACGGRYVSTSSTPLGELRAETGGFDLVVEAAGSVQAMADGIGLLARSGVACLLGIDSHGRAPVLDGRVLGVDVILENRAVFGSVNAHRQDWPAAVEALDGLRASWPDALEQFVGLRLPLDRFGEAFGSAGGGVKATLALG